MQSACHREYQDIALTICGESPRSPLNSALLVSPSGDTRSRWDDEASVLRARFDGALMLTRECAAQRRALSVCEHQSASWHRPC